MDVYFLHGSIDAKDEPVSLVVLLLEALRHEREEYTSSYHGIASRIVIRSFSQNPQTRCQSLQSARSRSAQNLQIRHIWKHLVHETEKFISIFRQSAKTRLDEIRQIKGSMIHNPGN